MDVELRSDFPVTDEACREATGKTLAEWSEAIAETGLDGRRRETITWLWDRTGRSPDQAWWGTTIYVEHERRLGRVQKDGRAEGYNICVTKTIAAPIDRVLAALVAELPEEGRRVREGKDAKGVWRTPGVDAPVPFEASVKETAGRIGVMINLKRIETRDEADGLRRAFGARLDEIKRSLES